jgi:lambda family phage portal protein
MPTKSGEIRMGVEYDGGGRVIRYWFRERNHNGDYQSGKTYSIRAENIIHCFVPQYPDQSRGLPWTHSALEATKHLEKYQESAIVNARASASVFNVLRSDPDDVDGDDMSSAGIEFGEIEAGSTVDIGTKQLVNVDPTYPHQMFDSFVKANLRSIASGLGVSYHALSNDLEGVNYSSIRAGVLEDREMFKAYQNWFIRCFIRPVFSQFIEAAYMSNQIVMPGGRAVTGKVDDYKPASYQGRRWSWVDPQKDGNANKLAIDERLKSRTQIIREQGDDPDAVWAEISKEQDLMRALNIQPINPKLPAEQPQEEE